VSERAIDQVIDEMSAIIDISIKTNSAMGYFPALYRLVTQEVRSAIDEGKFDDDPRMEKLDVIFARRYLDAYKQYTRNEKCSEVWRYAFDEARRNKLTVLQQLLLGMNAHINLDLGIAAAEVMQGSDIEELKTDFNRINDLLASLVDKVTEDLIQIWKPLGPIQRIIGKFDDALINFSMKLARLDAWRFAKDLHENWDRKDQLIYDDDRRAEKRSRFISSPTLLTSFVLGRIRRKESGTVAERIRYLID
jgi:hypothetical protein